MNDTTYNNGYLYVSPTSDKDYAIKHRELVLCGGELRHKIPSNTPRIIDILKKIYPMTFR